MPPFEETINIIRRKVAQETFNLRQNNKWNVIKLSDDITRVTTHHAIPIGFQYRSDPSHRLSSTGGDYIRRVCALAKHYPGGIRVYVPIYRCDNKSVPACFIIREKN